MELVLVLFARWPLPWPSASSLMSVLKVVMTKPLLEANAPLCGAHEGPESYRKCASGHERSRRSAMAWIRTTRSGARSSLFDLVACAVAVCVVVGVVTKIIMPELLIEAGELWSGAPEGPRS